MLIKFLNHSQKKQRHISYAVTRLKGNQHKIDKSIIMYKNLKGKKNRLFSYFKKIKASKNLILRLLSFYKPLIKSP